MSMQDDNTLEQLLSLSQSDLDAQLLHSPAPEGDAEIVEEVSTPEAKTTEPENKGDTTQVESSEPPAAAKDEDATADGVLAKDGKHVLPFKVVEDLREQTKQLERVTREQAEQIEALKSAQSAGAAVANVDTASLFSEEQLAALEQDLPELAKGLRAQQDVLKALLAQQAESAKAREQQEQAAQERSLEERRAVVQKAIDSVPKLAHLQATDPIAFQRAKEIDMERSKNPSTAAHWNAKPLEQRFKEVMVDYEARFGAVQIPSLPATPSAATSQTTAEPTQKPAAKPAGPITLSDLPGGGTPAADSRAEMAEKAGAEIIATMANWTPQQMEAYFASL